MYTPKVILPKAFFLFLPFQMNNIVISAFTNSLLDYTTVSVTKHSSFWEYIVLLFFHENYGAFTLHNDHDGRWHWITNLQYSGVVCSTEGKKKTGDSKAKRGEQFYQYPIFGTVHETGTVYIYVWLLIYRKTLYDMVEVLGRQYLHS